MNTHTENHHTGDEPWQAVTPALFSESPPSKQTLHLWALVLDARSIPCCLELHDGHLSLIVPPEQLTAARQELDRFYEENRDWPPALPDRRNTGASLLATLSTLLMLATFHNLTHLENSIAGRVLLPDLIALGKAQAGMIQGGEWWRIITALTLHADWTHLAGNLTIGGIFIFFLCREVGTGVAWLTILAAGIIGNATNAWVQQPSHSSVGASTAVFGAVGILAAIGMVQYRKSRQQRWQMPVAAAIALLGILGTEGNNTDIGAHLFGFGSGIGLGLGLALTTERYGLPGVNLNILAALTSIATVSFAWWLALTAAGGNTTLMLP